MIRNKDFYKTTLSITLPLALQNLISFCVQMLDMVMVGSLGDSAVSAVAIANQPYFIFQVFVYGLASGGAVLISQYWGKSNKKMIKSVMSNMLLVVSVASIIYSLVCLLIPHAILGIFSNNNALTEIGVKYLRVVVISYLFNGIANCLLTSMQAKEDVRPSTLIYLFSFFVNLFFNYCFIFGNFGFPMLGVVGAAIGTVIARIVEFVASLVYVCIIEKDICFRIRNALEIEKQLLLPYLRISIPVIGNDLVWSLGSSARIAIIGHVGASFIAAASVAGMAEQLVMIIMYGVAKSASIMVGKAVGAGEIDEAKQMSKIFLKLSFGIGILAFGLVLLLRNPLLMLYPNISMESKNLAYKIMEVVAIIMLATGLENTCIIGILRGSGDTKFAFAVDAGCMWLIGFPLGLLAAFVWQLPAPLVYFCLRGDVFLKILICMHRIFKGNYIKNVTQSLQKI